MFILLIIIAIINDKNNITSDCVVSVPAIAVVIVPVAYLLQALFPAMTITEKKAVVDFVIKK